MRVSAPPSDASSRRGDQRALWAAMALFLALAVVAARGAAPGDPAHAAQPAAGGQAGVVSWPASHASVLRGADSEDTAEAAALERAFERVIATVGPGVVGIRAQRFEGGGDRQRERADGESGGSRYAVTVNGSGTVIASDGLVLTNEHVIRGAAEILVFLHDGRQLPAVLVAADVRSDLAVLRIAAQELVTLPFGDWHGVRRGQWALVVGNPFGLGNDGQLSVSVGVVANLGRQLPGLGQTDDRLYYDMIQVTAPINPGNSGGPLVNLRGELIGIITAMHTRSSADDGIGFAIPLHAATRRNISRLVAGEAIEYGYLGLVVRQPDSFERSELGTRYGVVVRYVEPEGPAAAAGVQAGDILLHFDTTPISGPAQLAAQVGGRSVGASVPVVGRRGALPLEWSIKIGPRDPERVRVLRERFREEDGLGS
ncbi:MAG: trypsin-like peptidase domain-containing protein [Phycisphaerales bacterium]|nr:trypsin-like peptidase domain-containing protein [Phycisphaerales bacterium]